MPTYKISQNVRRHESTYRILRVMYDTKLSVDLLIQHHITFTTKIWAEVNFLYPWPPYVTLTTHSSPAWAGIHTCYADNAVINSCLPYTKVHKKTTPQFTKNLWQFSTIVLLFVLNTSSK